MGHVTKAELTARVRAVGVLALLTVLVAVTHTPPFLSHHRAPSD